MLRDLWRAVWDWLEANLPNLTAVYDDDPDHD